VEAPCPASGAVQAPNESFFSSGVPVTGFAVGEDAKQKQLPFTPGVGVFRGLELRRINKETASAARDFSDGSTSVPADMVKQI